MSNKRQQKISNGNRVQRQTIPQELSDEFPASDYGVITKATVAELFTGNHDLNINDLAVYLALTAYTNKGTGECHPSQETLCNLTGIAKKDTISASLKRLEKAGFAEKTGQRKSGKFYNNVYKIYRALEVEEINPKITRANKNLLTAEPFTGESQSASDSESAGMVENNQPTNKVEETFKITAELSSNPVLNAMNRKSAGMVENNQSAGMVMFPVRGWLPSECGNGYGLSGGTNIHPTHQPNKPTQQTAPIQPTPPGSIDSPKGEIENGSGTGETERGESYISVVTVPGEIPEYPSTEYYYEAWKNEYGKHWANFLKFIFNYYFFANVKYFNSKLKPEDWKVRPDKIQLIFENAHVFPYVSFPQLTEKLDSIVLKRKTTTGATEFWIDTIINELKEEAKA